MHGPSPARLATALVALTLVAARADAAGCGFPVAIWNPQIGMPQAGGFDLAKTPFAGKGSPGPEIRFWAYGHFEKANSGTQPQMLANGDGWLNNAALDYKVKDASPSVFSLSQANWYGTQVVGCAFDIAPEQRRTVVEISFADASKEGTKQHQGFYAITSVNVNPAYSSFDFDQVKGAGGPQGNVVPVEPIPVPVVLEARAAAAGSVTARVELPPAASFSEGGKDAPVKLVRGYRLLFAEGEEPTTSDPGKYAPVRDAGGKELGVVKPGTVEIAIPSTGKDLWVVAQLAYEDPAPLFSRATSAHVAVQGKGLAAPGGSGGRGRSREERRR